eukprot:CAMPEP_0206604530 /NCGR_PEP_ID=MMETSP0325_2-20121206/49466_1 /ASSEMBLY_ACC=CAM_ASM_000347 /TAXON_ID=2866 /ORGANISM="Crypthecodinium cohnii, Strain Seligo" /LENGTH=52 /DNA_ID=CAMNT_0054119083 /DNA_START=177 /DNA_END=331 /DNA_ORIENTATION=-
MPPGSVEVWFVDGAEAVEVVHQQQCFNGTMAKQRSLRGSIQLANRHKPDGLG